MYIYAFNGEVMIAISPGSLNDMESHIMNT